MEKLNEIDRRLLDLLQSDAKLTNKELAAQLGLSITPIYERIKRLEAQGVIRKYVALVDKVKVGKGLTVICMVQLSRHAAEVLQKFEQEIQAFPEVLECFHVAGEYDYLLKVVVSDMEEYQRFITKGIATLQNVSNVHSTFVMKEIKSDYRISLTQTHE
jgi:Lrp/AsnC family transcriptional regulator, leucine-responsive regulatory protein